jgi:small-conductance mechanosensitive channel
MDLTASQAADQAATILQGLDADAKKAGDQAAVARAWLDLARYLREQENSSPSMPHPSEPGKRIHPDAVVG